MSAAVTVPPTTADGVRPVLALARTEAVRLLRHPLFLVALALFVWQLAQTAVISPERTLRGLSEAWAVLTGFYLGLGGFLAMHSLTRSTRSARDVVGAAPLDETRRTLALCLACLVPFGLALLGGAVTMLTWDGGPDGFYSVLTAGEIRAFHATVLLAALGGPLLGVAVARWWRWPMAGVVVAIGLVAWSVSTGIFTHGFGTTLYHQSGPFSLALTGAESEQTFRQAGSWAWRVPYVACLCALALQAALLHGATGRLRTRLLGGLGGTAVVAVACLLMAAATGPDGVSLWKA